MLEAEAHTGFSQGRCINKMACEAQQFFFSSPPVILLFPLDFLFSPPGQGQIPQTVGQIPQTGGQIQGGGEVRPEVGKIQGGKGNVSPCVRPRLDCVFRVVSQLFTVLFIYRCWIWKILIVIYFLFSDIFRTGLIQLWEI